MKNKAKILIQVKDVGFTFILDKRMKQNLISPTFLAFFKTDKQRDLPVSYTHLDVYKRQIYEYMIQIINHAQRVNLSRDDIKVMILTTCLLYTSRCV